jgi:hypothetical protein
MLRSRHRDLMDSLAGSETAYKGFARLNRNKEAGSDGGMVKKERHGSKEPNCQGSRLMNGYFAALWGLLVGRTEGTV